MNKSLPFFVAVIGLSACGTVRGAASDARTVGETAVQMVRDIPDLPLPAVPQLDPSPFTEATAEVQAYCNAINERWKTGTDQVAEGEGLLSEGLVRMESGQQAVREGERRIATGELALNEFRRELALRTGHVLPKPQDFEKLEDPSLLKSIRVKMDQALRRMEYGGEQVSFGAREIEAGRVRMAEGLSRMKAGHALMAEDDGRCRELATRIVTVGAPILEEEPAD